MDIQQEQELYLMPWCIQRLASLVLFAFSANQIDSKQPIKPYRKAGLTIPLEAGNEFLDDDEELFACLTKGGQPFKRSLPQREALQRNPDAAAFLRKIVAFGRSEDSLENVSLDACYKDGLLQAEVSEE